MEDIAVYCSWADAQLDSNDEIINIFPVELRSLILQSRGSQYFEALSEAARLDRLTDILCPLYRPLLPELVARWLVDPISTTQDQKIRTLSSLGRILPLATYLLPHVRHLILSDDIQALFRLSSNQFAQLHEDQFHSLLLALFRILSYDRDVLTGVVDPAFFLRACRYGSPSIRYLAVQSLSRLAHFADALTEEHIKLNIGNGAILGQWEGRSIDYRILKLWEEQRWKSLFSAAQTFEAKWQQNSSTSVERVFSLDDLSQNTANVGGVLLPRHGPIPTSNSSFVSTPTAKRNLQKLGTCLLQSKSILLSGLPSSGKTLLVHEAARLLNRVSSMITLHLNEQTDAKSLIGIYTSASDGSGFKWQPGVLTEAIQQGRWILIEDIDRAPAEVMGVLRPILESGELYLPNRKEIIKPRDGFRVFATLTTDGRSGIVANSRGSWLVNGRIWCMAAVEMYEPNEIETLLSSKYTGAASYMSTILDVHQEIERTYKTDDRFKSLQGRQPSLKTLLTWTRRVHNRLQTSDQTSGATLEATNIAIFKDAIDFYAGYINDPILHGVVASAIASKMGISPQRIRHVLEEEALSLSETATAINIGRDALRKVTTRRRNNRTSPFALTAQAQRTLESISSGISFSEPCLLVGETGVGKTTLVQHIASLVGQRLTVVNLSQQSEASDLLGGLKPVTTRSLIMPIVETFNNLFEDTFSSKRNESFQMAITKAITKQNWSRLLILWREAIQLASNSLNPSSEPSTPDGSSHANKKRKLAKPKHDALRQRWANFSEDFKRIQTQVEHGDKTHTFAFAEGRLIKAVREGEWLLLDEINLATSDTLDYIVGLLHNGDDERPGLLLAEAGNVTSVTAHPNFRVFAAMNPATDAGKKDLSPGLRSRFTEIYVHPGDSNLQDLTTIVQIYLGAQLDSDKRAAQDLARVYLGIRQLNQENRLTDGAGDMPHFSIRSLVRTLLYVQQHGASHGLRRAMYEGFAMSFFTVLSRASETLAVPIVEKYLLSNVKNKKAFWSQQPKLPLGDEFVAFRHHLVKKGPSSPDLQPHYIRTVSVERNLLNLARAASMRRFPILLQGPTSAGKTSMVEYLAKLSGNNFVRVNNHEHTDLQEYLGSYASDSDGRLVYKEGVLVDALRQGHWIVLDELNLAPSDVLEALNRLLDDNRELLIPETQEVVRPHPNFMLFATQNPAGLYGGRKRLSRAFRNRFLELHFDDIPEDELGTILEKRSQIPPSYCKEIVAVYKKLSLQRQSSRLFEQRNSFATLRDLFRWAARPISDRQSLAQHGYMLLAERVRDPAERIVVKRSIEETMRVRLDDSIIYGITSIPEQSRSSKQIVWTAAMRRLFVLVSEALKNKEPVLLVGETGCGKTQICQTIAEAFGVPLNVYNAHTNTETGDLIGSQRPIRNRTEVAKAVIDDWTSLTKTNQLTSEGGDIDVDQIVAAFANLNRSDYDTNLFDRLRTSIGTYQSLFAWSDGSLVRSMRKGEHFLLDEISLADDSVLERLNSVLEPSRTILLAEKGSLDNLVIADSSFQFLATMNPGGDYGKRELSAALRNRLTEIWVPPLSKEDDILPIVQNKLRPNLQHFAKAMIQFAIWFRSHFYSATSDSIPLRDLLAWAEFMNRSNGLPNDHGFVHGAFLVYIDSLGASPSGLTSSEHSTLKESRFKSIEYLQNLIQADVFGLSSTVPELRFTNDRLQVGAFSIPRMVDSEQTPAELVFDAPTTLQNTMRIVRALQMSRPILLEGSPGVGKTAIVTALAHATGKQLTRINLSDQTDLMDLFGADAPSEAEQLGRFSWRNGPLLDAMQSGGWVLLDEMNLASQSVLEGLNSCLDHRQEAYIAELDKSFSCHPDFILFAAQNPHHQGGGRKGLPASFVNRFTVVYADSFQRDDLLKISQRRFPTVPIESIETVINTVSDVESDISRLSVFGPGGPWELNLRDVSRWLRLCEQYPTISPAYHVGSIITDRFRTTTQKTAVVEAASRISGPHAPESFYYNLTFNSLQVGIAHMQRDLRFQHTKETHTMLPPAHLPAAKSAITALNNNWPIVLTGPPGSGKTSLIRHLATFAGAELIEFAMNSDVDTVDLIGGFEQFDVRRSIVKLQKEVSTILSQSLGTLHPLEKSELYEQILKSWWILMSEDVSIDQIQAVLATLSPHVQGLSSFETALSEILSQSEISQSKFIWNDGILVDAVEKGWWLLLDNANLCNPSVLDRLNSLLEPNGLLVISEQHGALNGCRTIEPHPNFRIILTMDPRYGELSRAMRNRSLEIAMPVNAAVGQDVHQLAYPAASTISRFRYLTETGFDSISPDVVDVCLDNLSTAEVAILESGSTVLPGLDEAKMTAMLEVQSISATLKPFAIQSFTSDYSSDQIDSPSQMAQLITLNEPYVLAMPRRGQLVAANLFTRAWYIRRHISSIMAKMRLAVTNGLSVSANARTMLQKSALAAENSSSNTSAATFAVFVKSVVCHIERLFQAHLNSDMEPSLLDSVAQIIIFVQQLIRLFEHTNLDFSILSAYLRIGNQISGTLSTQVPSAASGDLALSFDESVEILGRGTGSSSKAGISFQLLWEPLKPKTATNGDQLSAQLCLEALLRRFDEVCRFLPQSRKSLAVIRSKLLDTYFSVLDSDQSEAACQVVEDAVSQLELQSHRGFAVSGKFEETFNFIYQMMMLQDHSGLDQDLNVTALFSPAGKLQPLSLAERGSPAKSLERLASIDHVTLSTDGSVELQVVHQLMTIHDQPLGMLEHVKEELTQLVDTMASRRFDFESALTALKEDLRSVLVVMLKAHFDMFSSRAKQILSSSSDLFKDFSLMSPDETVLGGQRGENFYQEYSNHLHKVVLMLNDVTHFGVKQFKLSLVHFAISGLRMMAPENVFDPALPATLSVELHDKRVSELQDRIAAQRHFHQQAFGQDSSLVIRILEEELANIGRRPPVPSVYRPQTLGLHQVREILGRITQILSENINVDEWLSPDAYQLHGQNLESIIDRLHKVDRGFDDFMKPISWFASCLLLGIQITEPEVFRPEAKSSVQEIILHTPLISSKPNDLQSWPGSVKSTLGDPIKLQWLRHAGLSASIYPSSGPTQVAIVKRLVNVVDHFYARWKTQLTKDQVDSEIQARYYAYRGDGDNDEALQARHMLELFPDFETDSAQEDRSEPKFESRARSVQLAHAHQSFYQPPEARENVQQYLLESLEALSKTNANDRRSQTVSFFEIQPAVSWLMEKRMSDLDGKSQSNALNIYKDFSTNESTKLFTLVKQVESRFRTIAEKWPEHAVPIEVLSMCQTIMHSNLCEPIAKLLVSTEKLFEMVAQWQSVASREWSVAELVDRLTALIVSWRRLELLSWSRLLDEESKRHQDDAQAWYFIAYEAIIYNTVRVTSESDLRPYCIELAQTLEQFLKTTTRGQYTSRLQLLDTLYKTLRDLTHDDKHLLPVAQCVANIIYHFRRYESNIEELLRSGRAEIEKALHEQIRLASWKDTNVTALRESARRSHLKLFRIVKKYRDLLSQPVTVFKAQNLEEPLQGSDDQDHELINASSNMEVVTRAVAVCAESIPDWTMRPERVTNTIGAVASIRRLYQSIRVEFEPRFELASFREELVAGIKELRSENPASATDDNEAAIRHLQERKRRLFTETIKAVMQMGVRRNLATSELERQSSAALVLACSPSMISQKEAFHELLDAMSTAREATTGHSDDLTSGEIQRSMGLLEGILFITLSQRNALSSALQHISQLSGIATQLKNIGNVPSNLVSCGKLSSYHHEALGRHTAWLAQCLTLSVQVLSFQARHSNIEITSLQQDLQKYSEVFRSFSEELNRLPDLPDGLLTELGRNTHDRCFGELAALNELLVRWQKQEPRIAAVLAKLVPWTVSIAEISESTQNGVSSLDLRQLDKDLRNAIDQIFVTLQGLTDLQQEFPSSIEDTAWLSKSDKAFSHQMSALHVKTIHNAIQGVLNNLHKVQPQDFRIGIALVQVATPIIEQYYGICDHILQRQSAIHTETCKLGLQLARSFTSLAKDGFCRPSKASDGEEQSGKLESGTGLGDGEGAEDISKDVGDDEDLSELAQSAQKEEKQDGEMENAEDAVDMGTDDLEGQTGEHEEEKSDDNDDQDHSDEEEGQDMDEETGSVDDLDPTAVDEKLWDDMKKESESEKELKNDKAKGTKSDDQTGAEGEKEEGDEMEGVEGEDEIEDDEGEGAERAEAENMDQHPEDQQALDLPEELDFVGDEDTKDDISDDGMEDLSDVEAPADETEEVEEVDGDKTSKPLDELGQDEDGASDNEGSDGEALDDEVMEEPPEEKEEEETGELDQRESNLPQDADEHAGGGDSGAANEAEDDVQQDQNTEGVNQSEKEIDPQQAQPGKAENEEQGDTGKGATERGVGRMDTVEQQQNDALRKLADVLDQWHQRREILPASEPQQTNGDTEKPDLDMAEADLEHIGDDQEADAQALGAASAEQARNLDQDKAIEDDQLPVDQDTDMIDAMEPEVQDNIAERFNRLQEQQLGLPQGLGALLPERQPRDMEDAEHKASDTEALEDDVASDIEHLDISQDQAVTSPPMKTSDAVQLWNHCSTTTHQFSLLLTEQLRLILSPTTATKLRGDFRTGKRLNIKRIIPYIASGYKRDKIWMRRSVPSKRNYQIMIAVDDSKSMAESGADMLAFETLALLTKSLSMLEAGELCVIGFGDEEHVRVAHSFGTPFSPAESGVQIFQSFGFNQKGTNVKNMVKESIHLFREARIKGHSSGQDLWQLQLIVSDGHCSDHAAITRLVRQAQEEKIIIVFVIVDAGDESILDLKEAVFEPDPAFDASAGGKPEMRVTTRRYLEHFPFPYYLVVRDVRDLPGVLATALKGWFGSVVDVQV
ncbi:hypothetical protein PV10_07197 [Exophiala mesophila]|uniref:Midasin n=1 Tax=Exophiala mesophila TaxID=212818 RepID=A0A0D1Z4U5_EXOME|nr:uncharacterized protein PV10_07197 [Exophiala mesophila]KIV89827.1 hypothetical protein PV10_07197 [Exophiala mesophila]